LTQRHPQPRHVLGLCLAVVLIGAGVLSLAGCGRRLDGPDDRSDDKAAGVGRGGSAAWSSVVPLGPQDANNPEARLCRQFMELKNAGDPRAHGLLGPLPAVPEGPVPASEADRLDAEFMLHQPFRVREVAREAAAPAHFVLVVDGSLASERLVVRTPTGTETRQRAMWSPDLVVEVRDGKIHGIRPALHED
jgi:hypothetical protein